MQTPPHVVEIITSIEKAERNKQTQQQNVPLDIQGDVNVAEMVKIYETATVPHASKVTMCTRGTVNAVSKNGSITASSEEKSKSIKEAPHRGQVSRLVGFFEQQTSKKKANTPARSFGGSSSQPQCFKGQMASKCKAKNTSSTPDIKYHR